MQDFWCRAYRFRAQGLGLRIREVWLRASSVMLTFWWLKMSDFEFRLRGSVLRV